MNAKPPPQVLARSTILPLELNEVFAFFSKPQNLERITPPELNFHLVSPVALEIGTNTVIDYRLKMWGIPFRWRSLISHWDPPHKFVDEQIEGPYKLWHHTHSFSPVDGGTKIEDRVLYRLPLWPVGELARPLIGLHLRRIFSYRERAIHTLLAP